MMKKLLLIVLGIILGVPLFASALSVFTYPQGGTGTTTAPVGQLIYGGATSYQSVATTSATCTGSASCSAFTVIGSSPISISASGGGSTFPFTTTSYGVATGTLVGFTNGLLSTASSTFTSNLILSTLTSGGLGVNSVGQIYKAATTTYNSPLVYTNGAVSCATCNTSSASVTSITGGTGLNGGTITTAGTLSLVSYIATGTSPTAGNLAYFGAAATPQLLYAVATSSLSAGSGISLTGTAGSLVGGTALTLNNVPNVAYTLLNATKYYTASTTASDNLSWAFKNGFVSQASSTFTAAPTFSTLTSQNCLGTDSNGLLQAGTCPGGSGSGVATTSLLASFPVTVSKTAASITYGFGGLSTSTNLTIGQVPYVTAANTVGQVATTSVSAGSGITFTGTAGALLGGTALTINNVPDVSYSVIGATKFYQSSTTATDNLTWNFNNGFVTQGSSTIKGGLTLPTALSETNGGTNQSTYTKGDILYSSNSNVLSKLGIGTAGQVLEVSNGIPAWAATSTISAGTGISLSTAGSVTTITNTGASFAYPFISSATSSLLSFTGGIIANSSSTITNLTAVAATTTSATTTNLAITAITSCAGSSALTTTSSGLVACGPITASGGTYPFTPSTFGSTNTSATSTAINDTGGLISTASSTLELLTILNSTTTNATTTTGFFGTAGATGDSGITVGKTSYEWSFGFLSSNNNFVISSSTSLGTSNALTIDKNLLATLPGGLLSQASSTVTGAFEASSNFVIDSSGHMGVGSTSPSALWGASFGTTTVFQNTQFGGSIASSTSAAATYTVNWESGNTQRFLLNQNTNFVINATSSNPRDGFAYKLKLCQDPTGSRTVTFTTPGQIRWWNGTTTVSSTANTCTWLGMIYDSSVQHYDIVASSTGILLK